MYAAARNTAPAESPLVPACALTLPDPQQHALMQLGRALPEAATLSDLKRLAFIILFLTGCMLKLIFRRIRQDMMTENHARHLN